MRNSNGDWVKLAELTGRKPIVEVLDATIEQVQFKVTYRLDERGTGTFVGVKQANSIATVLVSEIFTITPIEVLVENSVQGAGISQMRVYYPMLISDGENETDVQIDQSSLRLKLRDKNFLLEVLEPSATRLIRSKQKLNHRNGLVEPVYWNVDGNTARYRISGGRP